MGLLKVETLGYSCVRIPYTSEVSHARANGAERDVGLSVITGRNLQVRIV